MLDPPDGLLGYATLFEKLFQSAAWRGWGRAKYPPNPIRIHDCITDEGASIGLGIVAEVLISMIYVQHRKRRESNLLHP